MLSDILSFVLSKKFQQHMKEEQEPAVQESQQVDNPDPSMSQQSLTLEVLNACFKLLHALACKNEPVSCRT